MEANLLALSRYQIATFFENNAPITQGQRDDVARNITGHSVNPTACQGGNSYTVYAGQFGIQFRDPGSVLDMDLMRVIERAYSGFTPQHNYHGTLGRLNIYTMNNMRGISMYLARTQFFASAYRDTPPSMSYSYQLLQLRAGLPERFHTKLDVLIPQLPSLFAQDWSLVPNHTNLGENNIHVDPDTGAITGICDWVDAEVSLFGMSLSGLETMLGIRTMGGDCWTYFSKQGELRDQFWTAFYRRMGGASDAQKQRIEVARMVDLFLDNGFMQDECGIIRLATEESVDLRYLSTVMVNGFNHAGELAVLPVPPGVMLHEGPDSFPQATP
ncbi:hypothetical protein F4804DRAFT_341877 [Jackrogersella minutella]|nr:hypothetical protein F4804DRAFT_341877 [Jackrogersella minutella]